MTLRQLATALGGKIIDDRVIAPWPGGDHFRQLRAWPSHQAPDGVIVLPIEARRYVVERLRWLREVVSRS